MTYERMHSMPALASKQATKAQLLKGGARDLPARQPTRSTRQSIGVTSCCQREDQRLFRGLAVFAGGARLDAIESVDAGPLDFGRVTGRAEPPHPPR